MNGFKERYIAYPDKAEGWGDDGVYRPRREADAEACGSMCRRFREREETGWGVYEYHEGKVYDFECEPVDYEITAAVSASAPFSVYADGVKMRGVKMSDDGVCTFTLRACGTRVTIMFSPDIPDGEGDVSADIEVTDITAVKLPRTPASRKRTVFLVSDSTVQSYDGYYYPQTGWGEVLHRFFADDDYVREYRAEDSTYSQCRVYELPCVKIENRSIGGRSSRSFFLEGKWDETLSRAHEGDAVLFQFGHNDCTKARPNRYVNADEYKEWMRMYIVSSKARGLRPVLVSPVMRRNCGDGGEFTMSFADYREKLTELSAEYGVPMLDLGGVSLDILRSLGCKESKKLYLHAEPGEYEGGAYEKGVADDTHLSRKGALLYAREVAKMLAATESLSDIATYIDRGRI